MNQKVLVFALLGLSLFLLGCTQAGGSSSAPTAVATQAVGGASGSGVQQVRLAITHAGGYDPSTITVALGSRVKILATSSPIAHKHGVFIGAYGINTEVTSDSASNPTVIEFTADKAGEFDITCKTCESGPLGAHPWLKGKLIVR